MIRIFRFVKQYFREILRGLYFVAAVAIIMLALPNERRFKYEFQRGMEWMHEDLVAPFDFPIYKTDAEFIAERNAILNNFKPFFTYDTAVVAKAIDTYRSDVSKNLKERDIVEYNDSVFLELEQAINRVLQAGVMNPNEYSDLRSDIQGGITIVKNNQAFETGISDVYQVNRAVDELKSMASSLSAGTNDLVAYRTLQV